MKWRSVTLPPRTGHALVVDSRRDRLVRIGGGDASRYRMTGPRAGSPEVWTQSLTEGGRWEELNIPPVDGIPMLGMQAVYDSTRDRVLVVGGLTSGPDTSVAVRTALWSLEFTPSPHWTVLPSTSGHAPSARLGSTLVLDPVRDRLLLFGGSASWPAEPTRELWVLPLGTSGVAWTPVAPDTSALAWPPALAFAAAALTPAHDRMVLFGGSRSSLLTERSAETWTLDLEPLRWSRITDGSGPVPAGRYGHAMVRDPGRGGVLLMPGEDSGDTSIAARGTFLLPSNSHSWTRLDTRPWPPRQRSGYTAARDPRHGAIHVLGGNQAWPSDVAYAQLTHEVLAAEPTADWKELVRQDAGDYVINAMFPDVFIDVQRRRLHMVTQTRLSTFDLESGETWRTRPITAPYRMPQRMAAGFDPVRNRMIGLGGYGTETDMNTVIWYLDLDTEPLHWKQEFLIDLWGVLGQTPGVVFDPAQDGWWIDGGTAIPGGALWFLSSGPPFTLSRADSSGTWSGKNPHAPVIMDPVRQQILRFGGRAVGLEYNAHNNSLFVYRFLPPRGWFLATPLDPPAIRGAAGLILDPVNSRALMFGGLFAGWVEGDKDYSDLYELSLDDVTRWTRIAPLNEGPRYSGGHGLVYDPMLECAYVWNGASIYALEWPAPPITVPPGQLTEESAGRADLRWLSGLPAGRQLELVQSLDDGHRWQLLTRFTADSLGGASFTDTSPHTGRVGYRLQIMRSGGALVLDELWREAPVERLKIRRIVPMPSSGPLRLSLDSPEAGPIVVTLHDLAGRVVAQEVQEVAWGRRELTLTLGERRPPGVYLLRLRAQGGETTRRVVLMR